MNISKSNLPEKKLFAFALVMVQVIVSVLNVWSLTFIYAVLAS